MDGVALKEQGQQAVLRNEDPSWIDAVLTGIRAWTLSRKTFYLSEFREWYEQMGGRPPRHPNAWGGITRGLKGRGFRMTGRHRQSVRASNRGRLEFEWERI